MIDWIINKAGIESRSTCLRGRRGYVSSVVSDDARSGECYRVRGRRKGDDRRNRPVDIAFLLLSNLAFQPNNKICSWRTQHCQLWIKPWIEDVLLITWIVIGSLKKRLNLRWILKFGGEIDAKGERNYFR